MKKLSNITIKEYLRNSDWNQYELLAVTKYGVNKA